MSEKFTWTQENEEWLEAVESAPLRNLPAVHALALIHNLRAAIEEIDRLKQRVAGLTDSAEDWHRVADARAEELVKLQQRVDQLERSEDQLIGERDQAQEAADRLAYAIGSVEEIGEHSNLNCPWTNACELVEWKLKQLAVAEQRVAELERDAERLDALDSLIRSDRCDIRRNGVGDIAICRSRLDTPSTSEYGSLRAAIDALKGK